MKRSGSDYWKLYHDDFWDDEEVLPLNEAECGIYLYLLGLQAKHGSLPGSQAALDAIGRRFRSWPKAWPKLAKFFPIGDDGMRRNPRQAFENAETDEKRSKESDRKSRYRASKQGLSRGTGRGQDADVPSMSRLRGEERREEEKREESQNSPLPPPEGEPHPDRMHEKPKRQKTKRIDPSTHPLPPSLDTPEVREALVDYLATRKGGAWDENLAAVRLKEMASWGPARAVAALRHSVGYQGLFEPSGAQRALNGSYVNPGAEIGRQILREMKGHS